MESDDFTRHYIIRYLSARELVLPPLWARYLSFPMSAWLSLSRSELSSSSFRGIEVAISTSSSLSLLSSAFTPGSSVFTSMLHIEHQMQLNYSNSTIYSTILARFFFGLLLQIATTGSLAHKQAELTSFIPSSEMTIQESEELPRSTMAPG